VLSRFLAFSKRHRLEILALRQQVAVLQRQQPRTPLKSGDRLFGKPSAASGPARPMSSSWRWRSHPRGGRPRIAQELRDLTGRLAKDNPDWGAPKIRAELQKLRFCSMTNKPYNTRNVTVGWAHRRQRLPRGDSRERRATSGWDRRAERHDADIWPRFVPLAGEQRCEIQQRDATSQCGDHPTTAGGLPGIEVLARLISLLVLRTLSFKVALVNQRHVNEGRISVRPVLGQYCCSTCGFHGRCYGFYKAETIVMIFVVCQHQQTRSSSFSSQSATN
jgi:hypothetical protein